MKRLSINGTVVEGKAIDMVDQLKLLSFGGDSLSRAEYMAQMVAEHGLTLVMSDDPEESIAAAIIDALEAKGVAQPFDPSDG